MAVPLVASVLLFVTVNSSNLHHSQCGVRNVKAFKCSSGIEEEIE